MITSVADGRQEVSEPNEKPAALEVVAAFHRVYYERELAPTWGQTFWMGTRLLKCPLDLWLYQEIVHRLRPDLIVETGTLFGGSALYLAGLCDLLGTGRIVTVDVEPRPARPVHPRIEYLAGSSTAPGTFAAVRERAAGSQVVLVILDSDHSRDHVLAELRLYASLVTPRSYLIVEDTNIGGHPVRPDLHPGPLEAVQEFLRENQDFEVDRSCEKFLLSFNAGGYLRRIR